MFEAEAREYSRKYGDCLVDTEDMVMLEEAFKDGGKFGYHKAKEELQNENKKYKEMIEDMKADMYGTESKELFTYLEGILIKYGEVIK